MDKPSITSELHNQIEEACASINDPEDTTTSPDSCNTDSNIPPPPDSPPERHNLVPVNIDYTSDMSGFEFRLTNEGLYWLEKKDGKVNEIRLSKPLKLVAKARDESSMNWSRVLEFCDDDGVLHRYVLHMAELAMDGREVIGKLMSHGLIIYPSKDARDMLLMYVKDATPASAKMSFLTDHTGWHGTQFIFPDRILGTGDEDYIFESSSTLIQTYSQHGTLEGWKTGVAALCKGNSRLTFAVSAAFGSALLALTNDENGGFHFFGGSSTGKTHTLYAAASACGRPTIKEKNSYIHGWRGTSNGQEGVAKLHNDSLLILDEMGESTSKEVGEIAYMLANGVGKQRSHVTGEAKKRSNWRCLFLSSGEITLAQHMNEGGKVTKAGQEIRLLDIPAVTVSGHGVYENLHGIENGRKFSEELKKQTLQNYGTAFPAFIEAIIPCRDKISRQLIEHKEEFIQTYLPANAASQVHRVLSRFALVSAAGECATSLGITGWDFGEAKQAAAICFQAWLQQRESGAGMHETTAILRQVRAFFESHAESRFTYWTSNSGGLPDRPTANRAGFRRRSGDGFEYFILTECFKTEICRGYNPKDVAVLLQSAGILNPGQDGRMSRVVSLPGIGSTRCIHLLPSIMVNCA